MSPKALQLLSLLIDRGPDAVSKQDLYQTLWPDVIVEEANLKNLIAEIRSALDDDARNPRFVRTVARFGYAWQFNGTSPDGDGRMQGRFALLYLGREYPLVTGENVIGRDPMAQVLIQAAPVSRSHACLHLSADRAVLSDLGSKNGTWLNGRRITRPEEVADGDEIRLGSVALVFRCSSCTSTRTDLGGAHG